MTRGTKHSRKGKPQYCRGCSNPDGTRPLRKNHICPSRVQATVWDSDLANLYLVHNAPPSDIIIPTPPLLFIDTDDLPSPRSLTPFTPMQPSSPSHPYVDMSNIDLETLLADFSIPSPLQDTSHPTPAPYNAATGAVNIPVAVLPTPPPNCFLSVGVPSELADVILPDVEYEPEAWDAALEHGMSMPSGLNYETFFNIETPGDAVQEDGMDIAADTNAERNRCIDIYDRRHSI
ncbi:hypothetical protein NUW54_g12348 [Trametes sanguinea]|uniref:Uncharacterized protein n=1 Tax=Trametes sanguinea TaxID=158606 RepID=A0ACC1MZL5_9APHY|nr:hypothetical protein NUW54_g12348 [Trametes sanguinea]